MAYLTAFNYSGEVSYKTHFFPELRPSIIGHSDFYLCNDVLVIGSPHLWRFKQSLDFLDDFVDRLGTGIKLFYKMHPSETSMPKSNKLWSFGNFEVGCRVPRHVISPFSSLVYDLANEVKKYKNEPLIILNGFCKDYNDWYLSLFGSNILVSSFSLNYYHEDQSKFIGYVNEKNGIYPLSQR